jgi:hypothetical protein
MKQIIIIGLLVVPVSFGFAADQTGTFTGEIMDKQCAQMGSHENMMKAQGAKDAKECTLACIKNGDKFALLDSATKKVYPIENEKKVRQYAGQRVQITGTYDDDSGVLQVKTVAPAP